VYEYSSNSLYFRTAYALQGQKCSALGILFVRDNRKESVFLEKIKSNAAKRSLDDLASGPYLTHTASRHQVFCNMLRSYRRSPVRLYSLRERAGEP